MDDLLSHDFVETGTIREVSARAATHRCHQSRRQETERPGPVKLPSQSLERSCPHGPDAADRQLERDRDLPVARTRRSQQVTKEYLVARTQATDAVPQRFVSLGPEEFHIRWRITGRLFRGGVVKWGVSTCMT